MMELLEPQLSRFATLPEEFRKIIMKINEYYLSTIKETEFSQLKASLWKRSFKKHISWDTKIEELDVIISYINGSLPSSNFTTECALRSEKYRTLPCGLFYKLQWDHKQLESFLNGVVYEIIGSYSSTIREIDSKVARNKFPAGNGATKDFFLLLFI